MFDSASGKLAAKWVSLRDSGLEDIGSLHLQSRIHTLSDTSYLTLRTTKKCGLKSFTV